MSQEGQHAILSLARRRQFEAAVERSLYRSRSPSIEHDGIDVGFAADRRGIAKSGRDLLDDLDYFTFERAVAGVRRRGRVCEQNGRLQGCAPGSKVFGGEIITHGLSQIIVDLS